MDLFYDRAKQIFPQFNEIALTDCDFWRKACLERIIVKEKPMLIDGYYEKKKGKHYILINCELKGVRWLHTALHELFHFYFDAPVGDEEIKLCRSRIQIRTKKEKIADALALIGIMPMPELERLMNEDLTNNQYLMDLVRDRIAVLAIHHR